MKKYYIILILGLLFGSEIYSDNIFGILPYVIGIANDDNVDIYIYENSQWYKENRKLVLPSSYEEIFYCEGVIGVIKNGKINFYHYDQETNNYIETANDIGFDLPAEYNQIFPYKSYIGIVVSDKARFYMFDNNNWIEIVNFKFDLPVNSKGVFGMNFYEHDGDPILGIITDNAVEFYTFNYREDGWVRIEEMIFDLTLSYQRIIGFESDNTIGIITNDEIMIYTFRNKWIKINNLILNNY
ncbi:MAG: hypothetical protein LBB82_05945 [Treponema sp.]|nr:hypothetical protein [Treponema sp.]